MKVTLDNVEGTIAMQGVVVTFTPDGTAGTDSASGSVQFKSTEVTQLMRARKDMCCAKVVVGESSYLLRFASLAEREELVEMVVASQRASENVSDSPEQWVTASICGAAVDVGVLSQEELDHILTDHYQRGVSQAFDALESLVDSETLQLRVLTEQMENDVLRQIPILAAVFERTVVDVETKRSFWEAVVRKYFCFARTFLETEMHQLGQPSLPPTSEVAASSKAAAPDGLSAINMTSLSAMPKATAHATGSVMDNDGDEFAAPAHLANTDKAAAEPTSFVARLFRGTTRPKLPVHPRATRSAVKLPAVPRAMPSRNYGATVLHQLPPEATSREVLEALRRFWRHASDQPDTLIAPTPAKGRKPSTLEALCVERAKEVVRWRDQNTSV